MRPSRRAVPGEADLNGFFTRLALRAERVDSLLCVGLDPHPDQLTEPSAPGARDFCLRLIEATADAALAFKPNSAFFEMHGAPGWTALSEVIEAVPEEIPVILDAKRGDISSTALAYASAVFDELGADAVTLSPYLGHDSIGPFLSDPIRGAFLLCVTSNPGAFDFQRHGGAESPLYLEVARRSVEWNTADNLGLVVGATHPEALLAVRAVAPELWFLSPGVGAQGGELESALRAGLRDDGLGMVVPVSRAIARSESPGVEARRLRDAINESRGAL